MNALVSLTTLIKATLLMDIRFHRKPAVVFVVVVVVVVAVRTAQPNQTNSNEPNRRRQKQIILLGPFDCVREKIDCSSDTTQRSG